MNDLYYPRLFKRVRAVQIDSIIMFIAAIASLIIGDSIGVSSVAGKILLVTVPVFLLEPALLSITGATIGHRLNGIKVTKQNGVDTINIFAATVRFVVKVTFGAFSYIFLFTTKRHQAVHDLVARSIVTHRDVTGLPQYDLLPERHIEETGFIYPAAWKRVLGIVVYIALVVTFVGIVLALTVSDQCFEHQSSCVGAEVLINYATGWTELLGIGAVIVLGWKGRLYGFRRTPA